MRRGFRRAGSQGLGPYEAAAGPAHVRMPARCRCGRGAVKGSRSVLCARRTRQPPANSAAVAQGERPRAGDDRAGPRRPGWRWPPSSRPRASTTCSWSSEPTPWRSSSRPTPSPAAPRSRTTSSRSATRPCASSTPATCSTTRSEAGIEITKYGGICVLPHFDPAQLASLHDPAAEHLHRPAEADPGGAEGLRRSASRTPDSPGVRDHQLLADLLHRLRRDRELRHSAPGWSSPSARA